VESADGVLRSAEVDARLASDRGVDHGQQRRRESDPTHAAKERRGREACDVGHDPTAVADHHRVAIRGGFDHRGERLLHRGEPLVLLAGRQHHRGSGRDARGQERFLEP
jgi:hypothetical protein